MLWQPPSVRGRMLRSAMTPTATTIVSRRQSSILAVVSPLLFTEAHTKKLTTLAVATMPCDRYSNCRFSSSLLLTTKTTMSTTWLPTQFLQQRMIMGMPTSSSSKTPTIMPTTTISIGVLPTTPSSWRNTFSILQPGNNILYKPLLPYIVRNYSLVSNSSIAAILPFQQQQQQQQQQQPSLLTIVRQQQQLLRQKDITIRYMNRNARKAKRANHGKRPCSRIRRRYKTKKWANTCRKG